MSWLTVAGRVGLLLAAAAGIGWYYGQAVLAVAGTLLGLLVFWLHQMHRVQEWLRTTGKPPPETYGVWGDLLSQMYQMQKRGRDDRQRLQSTVDYLQDSFSSMRDGVAIVDDHGVLKWFNEPARLLLGLRLADEG